MNRWTYLRLLVVSLAVLLVAGCEDPMPACESADYTAMSSWSGDDFYNRLPMDGTVITDLTPSIAWEMWRDCEPGSFTISLDSEDGTPYGGTMDGDQRFFTPDPLEPGKEYFLQIRAWSDDYSMMGGPTHETNFFVGPLCTSLVAPILDTPYDGAYLYRRQELDFSWDYPGGCLPDKYRYQFATDPIFSNIFIDEYTYNASTSQRIWIPECMSAYWRVAAVRGSTTGPWSAPHQLTFVYNNSCWLNHEPSVEFGVIEGLLFEDICPDTGPTLPPDTVLLPGCEYDETYGIHGDGILSGGFRAEGEDPIPYHLVELGAGPCPSSGLDSDYTSIDGEYLFMVQTPGEYCLSVSENSSWGDGLWTNPLMDETTAEITVALGPSDVHMEQNFAWDDLNQFVIELDILETVFCRRGPTMDHLPTAVLDIGSRVPAIARDKNASWLMVYVNGLRCFKFNKDDPDMFMELPEFTPNDYPDPEPEPELEPDKGKKPETVICSKYSNIADCNSNPKCIWVINPNAIKVGGYCTNR
jgi:hypothetical protein